MQKQISRIVIVLVLCALWLFISSTLVSSLSLDPSHTDFVNTNAPFGEWHEIHPPHSTAHYATYRTPQEWEQVYAALPEHRMFFGRFKHHQSLSAFGELQEITVECMCSDKTTHPYQSWVQECGIRFVLKDENGVSFTVLLDHQLTLIPKRGEITKADPDLIQDMRSLQGTAYEGERALAIGDLAFHYKNGLLFRICFEYEETEYEVESEAFGTYPDNGQDTLTVRLLNSVTAGEAFEELCTQLHVSEGGEPNHPTKLTFKDAVPVIVGAIFGAVAVLVAFSVICKRAKNPPRPATCAGIDIPTEDAPAVNAPASEATPDGAPDSTPTPPDR